MSDHGRNLYEAGLEAGAPGTTSTVVLGSHRLALPARVAARVVACQGRKVFAVDPARHTPRAFSAPSVTC